MNTKIELNEVRDLTGRINVSFAFIKQNAKILVKNLLYLVPLFLIIIVVAGLMGFSFGSFGSYSMANTGGYLFLLLVVMVLVILISIAAMLFVISYISLYEQSEDGVVDTSEAWRITKSSLLSMTGVSILAGILMTVGFVLCIIPGIVVAIFLSVFVPAYIAQRNQLVPITAVESLSESYNLVKQDFWGSLAFLFVMGIIYMAFSFAISFFTNIFQGLGSAFLHEAPIALAIITIIMSIISYIGSLFFSIITYVAITFLYYDLKERRDGTSMDRKIDSIGQSSTTDNIY